jgi:DNA-binding response OmpR family regulator
MADTPGSMRFRGLRVLIAEDEYLLADDLRRELEAAGARVLGPVPSVAMALDLLQAPDAPDVAVLDVNLGGEHVYPVAEALRARGVPFVFVTGYDTCALPVEFVDAPRCEKPLDLDAVGDRLFGAHA